MNETKRVLQKRLDELNAQRTEIEERRTQIRNELRGLTLTMTEINEKIRHLRGAYQEIIGSDPASAEHAASLQTAVLRFSTAEQLPDEH